MSLESGYVVIATIHRPAAFGGEYKVTFETDTGGGLDSAESKKRNPVTRVETARGGLSSRGNATLTRECDAEGWALIPALEDSCERDDPITWVRQMVTTTTVAVGNPIPRAGVCKGLEWPDYDLESDDVGMISLEVSTHQKRG
jgi:hypothetical protein